MNALRMFKGRRAPFLDRKDRIRLGISCPGDIPDGVGEISTYHEKEGESTQEAFHRIRMALDSEELVRIDNGNACHIHNYVVSLEDRIEELFNSLVRWQRWFAQMEDSKGLQDEIAEWERAHANYEL